VSAETSSGAVSVPGLVKAGAVLTAAEAELLASESKSVLETAAIRVQSAFLQSSARAWVAGFGLGFAKGQISGATGAPEARMVTKAMQSGYKIGS